MQDTKTQKVPIAMLRHTTVGVRNCYEAKVIEALAASIKARGVLFPLLVREIWESNSTGIGGGMVYEVVCGEYRLRACKLLGAEVISEIPVIIGQLTYDQALEIALIEHAKRSHMTDIEQTEAYARALEFKLGMNSEMVVKLLNLMNNEVKNHKSLDRIYAGKIGGPRLANQVQTVESAFLEIGQINWRNYLVNRVPLLMLNDDIKQALRDNIIRSRTAKALALRCKSECSRLLEDLRSGRSTVRELNTILTEKPSRSSLGAELLQLEQRIHNRDHDSKLQALLEAEVAKLEQIRNRLVSLLDGNSTTSTAPEASSKRRLTPIQGTEMLSA